MPNYCYNLQVTFFDVDTGGVMRRARYCGHTEVLGYLLRDLFFLRLRFREFIRKQRPRRVAVRSVLTRIRNLHLTCTNF